MLSQKKLEKLHTILLDFYNATGVSISLRRPDFSTVDLDMEYATQDFCVLLRSAQNKIDRCTEFDCRLFEKCRQSRKLEIGICHAGLVDAAVPLFHDGVLLGYISLGQMKKDAAFSSVYDRVRDYPLDMLQLEQLYDKLPLFDSKKIESVARIAEVIAKFILFENMLQPSIDPVIERAAAFIDENLTQELTLDRIVQEIHVSKSTLYRSFSTNLHCTVGEYIAGKRVDKAIGLLRDTSLSMEEIARQTGFADTTGFIRTFRKLEGTTPLKFRRLQK